MHEASSMMEPKLSNILEYKSNPIVSKILEERNSRRKQYGNADSHAFSSVFFAIATLTYINTSHLPHALMEISTKSTYFLCVQKGRDDIFDAHRIQHGRDCMVFGALGVTGTYFRPWRSANNGQAHNA